MTVMRRGPAKAGMKKALAKAPVSLTRRPSGYATWLADVKARIQPAQQRAALAVNREMLGKYSPCHELTWRPPSPSLFLRPRGVESRFSRWIPSRSLSVRP
jgi:hypothetical protein